MIRVLVADDHEMFREMLRFALGRETGIEVVAEAGDGEEVLAMASRLHPDVVLLDYKMPLVGNFGELVRRLRTAPLTIQVVVLSGVSSEAVAREAATGGARGYVLKGTRLRSVTDAVRTVAAGGTWIDPHLPRHIFECFGHETNTPEEASESQLARLTRREREVLAYVARGSSNADIAHTLSVSEQTVKAHLTHIFGKLNVKNRVEATLAFYGKADDLVPAGSATWH